MQEREWRGGGGGGGLTDPRSSYRNGRMRTAHFK